ncbi:MAG: hypothetical protein K5864_03790 [Bacteroidales bacterium]|nr:hypothetical protein [Bacteroidales bacterium]
MFCHIATKGDKMRIKTYKIMWCVLLACCMIPFAAVAQHSEQSLLQPSWSDCNLKGKVKQVTELQRYSSGNDMNRETVYTFNSKGMMQSQVVRGFGGERVTNYPLKSRDLNFRYTTDWGGDLVEVRHFNMRGQLVSSVHYIYAADARLLQTVAYGYGSDTAIVTTRTVSKYNKKERLTKVEQYSADELLLMKEQYKYDKHGNLTRRTQTFYSEEGTKTTTVERRSYVYDKQKNWTSCTYYNNGRHYYTLERTLVYY